MARSMRRNAIVFGVLQAQTQVSSRACSNVLPLWACSKTRARVVGSSWAAQSGLLRAKASSNSVNCRPRADYQLLEHLQTSREIMGGGGTQAVRKERVQVKRFANNTAAAGR